MLLTHFKKLFAYDRHMNITMLDELKTSGIQGYALVTMAHLLASQQTWLKRCENHHIPCGPLWPDWPVEEMQQTIEQNYQAWMNYLDTLQDTDLDKNISYKNTKGEAFTTQLSDIIAHLINHGTHHRAQIGQLLKFAGAEKLPVTDYIFYIRQY